MVNAKEMALAAAKALDSKKGRDIKVLEIDKITTLADYFVICSGGSNTQINALCDEVEKELDLYLTLKPLKSLLKLSAMKQPCMEEFLGIKDRIYDNGKECIKLYKDFLKKRDAFTADEILGHNLEDVLGLGRIFDMLGYLCIYDGDYEVTYSEFDGDNLILKLKLPCTLPQEFSNGNTDFYLTGKDEEINLIIKTTDGKLKQYYADYKDYYYLPEEDTVIPKSLGSGIDRKHRKAATRNTCYTWFTCSDAFLSSPVQQKQYLTYTLSCLIETLERV